MNSRLLLNALLLVLAGLTGCVTTSIVGDLPPLQPAYRINEFVVEDFIRSSGGAIARFVFRGEILQAGWEADENRLHAHTFALQFPSGFRAEEQERKTVQCFMQYQPVFKRKNNAPKGNSFEIRFDVPLTEKEVKNFVFQIMMGDNETRDFRLFQDGEYYPEGKLYESPYQVK